MSLPTFDELPKFHNYSGCAWSVWGSNDEIGTVNLLTDELVARTTKEEIRTGKTVSLNWPVNFPEKPMFSRKTPELLQKHIIPQITTAIRDDELHINTQSGTQWDGLRHFGVIEQNVFYNNVPADSLPVGRHAINDPNKFDENLGKIGIQKWAEHGICGRGVLLDLVKFYTESGSELPYDPWATHSISVTDLEACAKKQGVEFRTGDILLLRIGFIRKYNTSSLEEKMALGGREPTSAGIEQSEDMKRFLWNNHFGAVASDQPALESWPPAEGVSYLHSTILGMFGMPLGEFFDLEKLAETCAETGRYTFFMSSWPLNLIGGAASPANAAAYF